MVSKDELFEVIWDGRFVSDATLASRVRSARAAIGPDTGRPFTTAGPENSGAASARQRTAVSIETVSPMGFLRAGKTDPETGSGLYRGNRRETLDPVVQYGE